MALVEFKLDERAELPLYKHFGDSGADIRAHITEQIVLSPFETKAIPTGLYPNIPYNYEIQVRPRSGLALQGIHVANTPGTVDASFKGEIKVILYNASKEPFTIHDKDRIAQIVISPVEQAIFKQVNDNGTSDRGTNGFGSTGLK